MTTQGQATYTLSEPAEQDIENLIYYTIEIWGKAQALRYVDGFEKQAQLLAEMPSLGTFLYKPYERLRAFPYGHHVLFYQEKSGGIAVVRVLHKNMSRDLHLGEA